MSWPVEAWEQSFSGETSLLTAVAIERFQREAQYLAGLNSGTLQLTPLDPGTGLPTGPSYEADLSDQQIASFTHEGGMINGTQMQTELPRSASGHGRKVIHLRVGLHGADLYRKDIDCTL